MSKIHKIKILPCFADDIFSGEKTFEIRENDRGYQKGDIILFHTSDGSEHKINAAKYRIAYVLSGYGLKNGYVVLGLSEISY